jgi:hypothetical protein
MKGRFTRTDRRTAFNVTWRRWNLANLGVSCAIEWSRESIGISATKGETGVAEICAIPTGYIRSAEKSGHGSGDSVSQIFSVKENSSLEKSQN